MTGCSLALVVALLAVMAAQLGADKPQRSPVYLYSTCACLLVLIFVAVGGALTAGGIALKLSGNPVSDFFANCEKEEGFFGDTSYCQRKKTCSMFRDIRDKVFMFALGTGVPLFVAGEDWPKV